MDISFCDLCDGSIPNGDRKKGAARTEEGLLLCAKCLGLEKRRRRVGLIVAAGALLLAAALGALASWLILSPRIDDLRAETDLLRSEIGVSRQQIAGAAGDRGQIRDSVRGLGSAMSGIKKALEGHSETTAAALEELSVRLGDHGREVAAVKEFAEGLARVAATPAAPPTTDTWIVMATSEDVGARLTALMKLESVEDERVPAIVKKALGDPEAVIRAQAAAMAGRRKLEACLPVLVQLLVDESDNVRDAADAALEAVAGVDFGFDATASEAERQAAVDRVTDWLEDRGS